MRLGWSITSAWKWNNCQLQQPPLWRAGGKRSPRIPCFFFFFSPGAENQCARRTRNREINHCALKSLRHPCEGRTKLGKWTSCLQACFCLGRHCRFRTSFPCCHVLPVATCFYALWYHHLHALFQILCSRKFLSAKNSVKSDRQAVGQEIIFVKRRSSLVCSSVVRSPVFCFFVFLHIQEYLWPTLLFLWKTLVRNLI